jgi:hypothetical protein
MTKAQQRALASLSGKPYGIVSRRMAEWMVGEGLARYVTLSPAPRQGAAVSLTARGRGVAKTGTPSAPEREEATRADRTTERPTAADSETLHPVPHSRD